MYKVSLLEILFRDGEAHTYDDVSWECESYLQAWNKMKFKVREWNRFGASGSSVTKALFEVTNV